MNALAQHLGGRAPKTAIILGSSLGRFSFPIQVSSSLVFLSDIGIPRWANGESSAP